MADRPLKELNYRTPLEAANLKSMDQLASAGASGLLNPITPGVVPGSDVANLSIRAGRIAGADVIRDGFASYGEKMASRGTLGRIRGRDLMPIILDLIGKMEKLGE